MAKAKEIRRQGDDERAFRLLGYSYAQIRDRGVFDLPTALRVKTGLVTLPSFVLLEYSAVCTQHAFRIFDESWHGVSIAMGRKVYSDAVKLSEEKSLSMHDQAEVIEVLHLAETDLGLSFQRPFKRYRNTELAVVYSHKAYQYYWDKANDVLSQSGACRLESAQMIIFNAVKYCGNYASALYQRALDLIEREPGGAFDLLRRSLDVRGKIEEDLITELSDKPNIRKYRSMVLRANTMQTMGRCRIGGGDDYLTDAQNLYESVIGQLQKLDFDDKSLAQGIRAEAQRVFAMAEYGYGWCLYHLGFYCEALSAHEVGFKMRLKQFGATHIDTRKSRNAVNQLRRAIASSS